MLREQITQIIEDNFCCYDKEAAEIASKEVLKHLNSLLDLGDNGWFDDDPVMEEFLE